MAPSTRGKRVRSDESGGGSTLPPDVTAKMPKKGTGRHAPKSKASKKKTTKMAEQRGKPSPPKGEEQQKNPTKKRGRVERRGNESVRSLTEPMETPVFRPTEEEFANFHEYACKLDKLVSGKRFC